MASKDQRAILSMSSTLASPPSTIPQEQRLIVWADLPADKPRWYACSKCDVFGQHKDNTTRSTTKSPPDVDRAPLKSRGARTGSPRKKHEAVDGLTSVRLGSTRLDTCDTAATIILLAVPVSVPAQTAVGPSKVWPKPCGLA